MLVDQQRRDEHHTGRGGRGPRTGERIPGQLASDKSLGPTTEPVRTPRVDSHVARFDPAMSATLEDHPDQYLDGAGGDLDAALGENPRSEGHQKVTVERPSARSKPMRPVSGSWAREGVVNWRGGGYEQP